MKKILVLFVIIFISKFAICQCPPDNGDNIYYPELDKFLGTWKYANGTTEAIITFKKEHQCYSAGPGESYFEDGLIGVYKVSVNNQIVFDNTADFTNFNPNIVYAAKISLGPDCNVVQPNFVKGFIKDVVKEKYVDVEITYIPTSIPEIYVHQYNPERFGLQALDGTVIKEDLRHPKGTFIPGFTVPTNVNFIKQQ
ncbi:MAG: DUF6705 family protein [Ferruginibacter sp.]